MTNSITKKELRKFGIVVGLVFPILIGLIIPFIRGHSFSEWTLFFSIPLLLTGIFKPKLLYLPFKIWISLGNFLGRINSPIILGLVYILVLLPISFLMKIFGYDPLRLKRYGKKTYRELNEDRIIDLNRIF